MAPLLEVNDLRTQIKLREGVVHAVDGVSFQLEPGETLGIVGESGCGKTMTALSIMNLLPTGGHIATGSIKLNGQDLTTLSDAQMRSIRGNEIGMIFQDPLTSLNPTMTVGRQIAEAVSLHREVSKEQAMDRAAEVLAPLPRHRRFAAQAETFTHLRGLPCRILTRGIHARRVQEKVQLKSCRFPNCPAFDLGLSIDLTRV